MKKINEISGHTIPLAMDDVDTDLIIPAQYLTAVTRAGYGKNLFKRLRDANPNFVFNDKKYSDANILITKSNFGCGSSREHAVWALQEAGIQAIIAISFSDIFYSNSAKNGLVLIALSEEIINKMLISSHKGVYRLTVSLENQTVFPDHDEIHAFQIDPFRKHCLVNGLDDLDYLLSHRQLIEEHKLNKTKK
jgi:3-isopropylmalate/(R)-2-methylmalate dehydratase small subunit